MTARVPYAEVIGDPIGQSLSPTIHRFWLSKLGIEADYRRKKVGRSDLADYLSRRRKDRAWRGTNVTMPLKLDALAAADSASDLAVAAGAANLLVPREGKLHAANSDVGAVIDLLRRLDEQGRAMQAVALFGTGGAARAVLVAARALNIAGAFTIHARDMAKGVKLAVEFGVGRAPVPFDTPADGDGIVNCTPLGMAGRDCLPCDPSRLSDKGWVFDMVSAPARTPLIAAAQERGLATVDGIDMLVEQAETSFSLFFETEAPRAHDDELFAMLRG
ncbi:shikimate dehydrogenase family protein [Sphingomicrobium nitratireducens]|uniref:shikimate dehydrogenase family protein n=1 Tax=Sphingomicrobium nitratireducens TaxID=2964666 RepID=UPI00223FCDF5|nr:shikimate dehydrogenase [Sphingomicrobium nitratireducens]